MYCNSYSGLKIEPKGFEYFILGLVIDVEVVKTNTSILGICQDTYLHSDPFCDR